jgi:hypothetical protein
VADSQTREAWCMRERAIPISTVLNFAPDGLVLGAGTVLLRADGPHRLKNLTGRETRVLALLSAAYGRAVAPSVLGNIERAAKAWREGDDCLAYIHLAHARLGELPYPHDAAQRLGIVDAFLKAGGRPRTIFEALKAGRSYIDALEKDFNPDEARVPAGSGKPSGEWTRDGAAAKPSLPSYLAPGAASWLGDIAPSAATSLGDYALSLLSAAGGAVVAFGLVFIPSPNNVRVEGEVQGVPGLRYSWNRDETSVLFTCNAPDGTQRTFTAQGDGNVIRDAQGRIIGRILPEGGLVIDPAAVLPQAANDNEPRLCPMPGLDKPGERGRDYEDYVKSIVNPENPTPRYWGFQLVNPTTGQLVYYDDCQHTTGMMVDAKGPGYVKLLSFPPTMGSVIQEWVAEGGRQIAASGDRPVRWYFAEEAAADFARELFIKYDNGLERIEVIFEPWTREGNG